MSKPTMCLEDAAHLRFNSGWKGDIVPAGFHTIHLVSRPRGCDSDKARCDSNPLQPGQHSWMMFLAKALYDNIAESPDELAFRRGDVLTVMEQNTSGLDGWWLCSLRGRQGIAPGNRLKILSGMVDGLSSGKAAGQQTDSELVAQKEWRRSLEKSPNKGFALFAGDVVTPQKKGEVYVYKQPNRSMEDYDVPPSRYFPPSKESSPEPRGYDVYDTPNSRPAPAGSSSLYDTPPSSKRASCERTPPGSHRASLDSNTLGPARRLSGEQVSHTPPSSKRSSADGGVPVERHYETPPSSKRASLERILSDDNPTYDIPSSSKSMELPLSMSSSETAYDSPSYRRLSRDSTGTGNRASLLSTASTESCLSGSSSQLASNRLSAASASLPDSARSSLDASLHDAYDLPPREARALKQLSMDFGAGTVRHAGYVDSRGSGADYTGGAEGLYEELLLDLDSALELLVKLQQEVSRTSSRLLAFVSSTWRQKDSLHKRIYDIKVACVELNKALGEYVDFAQGTLANSARLSDKKLVSRLVRHVTPIQQHKQNFSQALRGLEEMKWQVNLLVEPVEPGTSDDLGTIINLAKELVPDAKKLGSLIQERPLPPPPQHQHQQQQQKGKDSDLAGALDNLSDIAHKGEQSRLADDRDYSDLIQEYDYVQLEARDVAAQQQGLEAPAKAAAVATDSTGYESGNEQSNKDRQKTPQHLKTVSEDFPKQLADVDLVPTKRMRQDRGQHDRELQRTGHNRRRTGRARAENSSQPEWLPFASPTQPPPRYLSSDFSSTVLEPSDKQVLVYYSGQLETHATLLTNAIDAFFTCIENNEPPKVFISNSKFVIVTAHKLVYISDALHRSLANCEVRNKVMHCANHMCECLKISVQATKVAALQYPSVPAVQEMVDRVVDVSHAAHELKLVITQASAL
ncbi:enhancer of filamentation 1-like [Pomacea canaliculata]|uniref:enhancer of filamentation 1-like n=1 Tax=Pomacea canaliculata TaxID=400727 RepID=UPI000D728E39|nr:enhancer of filamentation 1-like [Pomacea canaliculata]